jgi:hypothetical protein
MEGENPGTGNATPIIWDKQVFVQTAIPTGKKVEAPKAENSDQGTRPPRAARMIHRPREVPAAQVSAIVRAWHGARRTHALGW